MSLVIFTAFVGIVAAPGTIHPWIAARGAAGDRGRRRRGRCPQHVVRRRHRRGDAADRLAARAARRHPARRGTRLRPDAGRRLGPRAGASRQCRRRRAAGLHHLLLHRHLHDVAEAADAAEHRHRRCRRRLPADGWLGLGDRQRRPRLDRAVPHHLHVDAAAFLGAGAVEEDQCRLQQRRRADAAGGGRRRRDPPPDPHLLRCCWCRSPSCRRWSERQAPSMPA